MRWSLLHWVTRSFTDLSLFTGFLDNKEILNNTGPIIQKYSERYNFLLLLFCSLIQLQFNERDKILSILYHTLTPCVNLNTIGEQ